MYPWHPRVDFPEIGLKVYGSAWKVIIRFFYVYIYMYIYLVHITKPMLHSTVMIFDANSIIKKFVLITGHLPPI